MECVVEELNLLQLWEADILHHRTAIEDISMRATKQWALEKKLNELVDRLKVLKVEFLPQYETWVLKSIDEVQQVMDDEMNALIILKSSAFIKPILNRANLTEQKILLI
jgi:dynein heavy chain